jgi:hypothetical protein
MKPKDYDIFHGVMLSYMEVVEKNWECFTHLSQTFFPNGII